MPDQTLLALKQQSYISKRLKLFSHISVTQGRHVRSKRLQKLDSAVKSGAI